MIIQQLSFYFPHSENYYLFVYIIIIHKFPAKFSGNQQMFEYTLTVGMLPEMGTGITI